LVDSVSERLQRASASKSRRGRPLGEKATAIRDAVLELTNEFEVMTVRQVFYQLVSRGIVSKSENGGYRPIQTQVLRMRREGLLPWGFIADSTRWRRKPGSWDSVNDVLLSVQRSYRRNLWRSQWLRIEVWLEKDALAGVVMGATEAWDVSLMVSRGTSSATFLHSACEAAEQAAANGVSTLILALYDYDAAGARAARMIENGFRDYFKADGVVEFVRLAVTEEQIQEWTLPTRPAKTTDPEAHKFGGGAVELDAIPPDKLVQLVEDAITDRIEPTSWRMEQATEKSEREILERIAGEVA
jgi:hypothetical protein